MPEVLTQALEETGTVTAVENFLREYEEVQISHYFQWGELHRNYPKNLPLSMKYR